ncbi:MAG: hypothetical protein Q4G59_04195, partial [Planctomycetia bacterium]|nr:hypothetical protein [Planctomycetia bacterium]
VSELMIERSGQLAKAPRDQWGKIVADSEAAIKATLTPQQLERFERGHQEKKITLRFRKENWDEVLKWFAAEVGLQLVMDAPPPGTFNYNDRNEYTPKDALDIINGALQFKGYTLLRNGEMLMLHNFKNGHIPLQYLPKITPEDLEKQSRFDYVALTLPLGSRALPAVMSVITPFRSQNTFIQTMPGNSIMIVDSVNVLREIVAAALGVEDPGAAAATATPQSVPEWRAYTLKTVKPEVVKEQVTAFAPDAKVLMNPESNQISFLAIPAVLDVISGLVEKLDAGTAVPQWRAFPLKNIKPETVRDQIASFAPDAKALINPESNQISFLATPTALTIIAGLIEKLDAGTAIPQWRTFTLKNAKFKTVREHVMAYAPEAKALANPEANQISFLASPAVLDVIAGLIEKLDAAASVLEWQAFTLKNAKSEVIRDQVAAYVPEAKVLINPESNQISFYAGPSSLKTIAALVEKLDAATAVSEWRAYALKNVKPEIVRDQVASYAPEARVLINPESNQISFFAAPSSHKTIAGLIEKLDAGTAAEQWQVFPLKSVKPEIVRDQVAAYAPGAKVLINPESNQISFLATPAQLKTIAGLIEKLDAGTAAEQWQVFPLKSVKPEIVRDQVAAYAPGAKVLINPESNQISFLATPTQLKTITGLIEKLDSEKAATQWKAFTLKNVKPEVVQSQVAAYAPEARVLINPESNQISFLAVPAVLETITGLIEKLDSDQSATQWQAFVLKNVKPDLVKEQVASFAPEAKVLVNPESNQISFLATPSVLKTIAGLVEKLDAAASRPPKMISYPVYGIVPTTLAESLQKVYPTAKIEVDDKGRRLLIWATLDEHVRISDEIAQINGKNAPDEQGSLGIRVVMYVVPNQSQARQAEQIIKALVPGAEIFIEPALYSLLAQTHITVVATVMEQQQISKMFEQINTPANDNPLELVCYPFGNANPITIETLLHGLLLSADSLSPQKLKEGIISPARLRSQYRQTIANNDIAHPFFRVDPNSKIVAIFANQADHQRAKKAIETVAALDESQSKLVSKIYTLTSPIASTLLAPLRELVPGAQLTSESATEIIAFASVADIAKLDEFIAGVADTQVVNSRHKMRLVVIPENTLYPRARIIGIMTVQFRDSGGQVYPGAHSNQLILWGHKDILDRMQTFLEETFKQTTQEVYKSYLLKNMEPRKAVDYLEKMCPNATYESDTEKRSVTAFGTPFVQQQIAKALETLDAPRPKDQELIVRYYTFDETVPSAFRTTWRTLHAQFPSISIVPD